MKKKSLNKKLNLNKSTIYHLSPVDLNSLKGGLITQPTGYTCAVCNTNISCDPEGDNCQYVRSCVLFSCEFCLR